MQLYKKWVPKWLVHFCNFFLVVVFSNALLMNIIGFDMSHVQGHFGATAQELQLSIQLPFAILLACVPIGMAMAFGLQLRPTFIVSGLATAFFYLGCLFAPTIYWFTFFKALLCISGLVTLLCSVIPIMLTYNPTFNMPLLFAILYSIVFGLGDFFKFLGTHIISVFNWEFGFLFFISLVLASVAIVFILFKSERVLPKPKGGGSLDLPGFTLLLALFIAITFILVKGPNEHWFESRLIQGITALCISLTGLYILHAAHTKNAYVQLEVFTYKNTLLGGFLLMASGFLLSTSGALNGLMGMSGFNNIAMGRAYLPQVLGVVSASVICVAAIKNKVYLSTIMALGFIAVALFHLSMARLFYNGIGTHDFFWPLTLRGAGHVFLYLSLAIYVAENIPKHLSASRAIVSVFFKIILGAFIGGASFGYFTTKDNELHATGISQGVTVYNSLALQQYNSAKGIALLNGANEAESNQFAAKVMLSKINQPASLLANKDMYLVCGIISLLLALVVSLFKRIQHPPGNIVVEPVPL
jgi:DHA2 family multidrug resistance protein